MSAQEFSRLLTTILFSDIYGYSRFMQEDEGRTLGLLAVHNAIFQRAIAEHRGRVVKTIGDAFMVQFPAPSEAVHCAVAVQQALNILHASMPGFDIEVRIGIHVGEVAESGADLLGKHVNVASRTEGLGTPGWVTLTEDAVRHLAGRVAYRLQDRGKRAAKNVGQIWVFEIDPVSEPRREAVATLVEVAGRAGRTAAVAAPEAGRSGDDWSLHNALQRLARPAIFVPRPALLREVVERVRHGQLATTVLHGLPGIGKTAMLTGAAGELQDAFPHVLAMRFDGPAACEPAYLLDELNAFLTALGRGIDRDLLSRRAMPQTLELLRARLADVDAVVLLDGVESLAAEWRDRLLSGLITARRCRTLLTARERPVDHARAHMVLVPPLSDPEAATFIEHHKQVLDLDIDPAALLRRLPTAVRSHPQALAAFLTNLSDLPLELVLADGLSDHARAVHRLVARVVEGLDPEARAALAFATVLSEVDLERALRALRLRPPLRFLSSLQGLLGRSLIHRTGNAYAVPAIVAAAVGEIDPAAVDAAAAHVFDQWRESRRRADVVEVQVDVLAAVATRLSSHFAERAQPSAIRELSGDDFLDLLNYRGHWKEYAALVGAGLDAARRLGDRAARVQLGFRQVRKAVQAGMLDTARATLEEVRLLVGPEVDTLERADLHSHLALLQEADRDEDAALRSLAESGRIRRTIGDQTGLAVVQKLVGNLSARRQQWEAARRSLEQALELLAGEPGSRHRIDAATTLALCDLAAADPAAAEGRLRTVLEDCGRFGYPAGRPRALLHLALAVERRGRLAEARDLARAAAGEADRFDPLVARVAEMVARRLDRQLFPVPETP